MPHAIAAQPLTLTEAREQVAAWKNKFLSFKKSMTEGTQAMGVRALESVAVYGGGALVGLARGALGDPVTGDLIIPGVDVEAELVAAVLGNVIAIPGFMGEASDGVNLVASGIGAAYTAREIENAFKKARAAAAKAKTTATK